MTWEDPIVAEVRKRREEIFAECGYDLRVLGERLKRLEAKHKDRLVDLGPGKGRMRVAEEHAEYGENKTGASGVSP